MIEYQWLGTIHYTAALELQNDLRAKRSAGKTGDRILFLEHPPVITQGKRECQEDFISDPETIARDGIEIVRVDRGGRLTYHGPGQLVGYFICDVTRYGGVRLFVESIEKSLVALCSDFGIEASRNPDHPGVWVGRDKIAAVGLHVNQNITTHGFALNVSCDLSPYDHIVACGIRDRGVTSIFKLTKSKIKMDDVIENAVHHLGSELKTELVSLRNQPGQT